jgi:hypothetical protein
MGAYPNSEQIQAASLHQLEAWRADLPIPSNNTERAALHEIYMRIRDIDQKIELAGKVV